MIELPLAEHLGQIVLHEQSAQGGPGHDIGKRHLEKEDGHERQGSEDIKHAVLEGFLADAQHRFDDPSHHHRLDAVECGRHRRYVDVGHGQIAEQQHHED